MQVGRIPLVVGGIAGFAGLLVPSLSVAQAVVDTYVDFSWYIMTQQQCVDRGASAVNEAIANFDLTAATTREDEWYVLADANDPVFWVFCIADDNTDAIIAPNAKRILVNITASGTDGQLSEQIRDFLVTCMEGVCP